MIRDFAVDTVLVVLVGAIPSKRAAGSLVAEGEKKLLPIFERAVGLGTKETLPSFPRAPVPSDDIKELVWILNDDRCDRDDRFGGVTGADPTFFWMLTLDFFFDLLRYRFDRGERFERFKRIIFREFVSIE